MSIRTCAKEDGVDAQKRMHSSSELAAVYHRASAFADIQFEQNTLYLINSELKSTKR
jgi:hypothetical protein